MEKNNEEILKWIKRAQKEYKKNLNIGMCWAFRMTCNFKKEFNYDFIHKIIPEFHINTFENTKKSWLYWYWWPIEDRQSRINAFDKLIKIYEEKINTPEKISSYQIFKWIKRAKKTYLNIHEGKIKGIACLCVAFTFTRNKHIPNFDVTFLIPEFNRENFENTEDIGCYWWPIEDKDSRLKALDKLIKIYKRKRIEEIKSKIIKILTFKN